MAKLTRLASTLIARYYPSKTHTDAFYMDGRLFGKRESRNADITIDKEEKGFFFSVFSHPTIPGYEPGMIPPYEPQLSGILNEVKFGRKPIDAMISGFLSTAVDVTGKLKLQDQDNRSPYFAGIIVHDSEAFAVTIGSGLAFLYRNDTLYPLTDAGIPIEPIDAYGNRVGDFYNYVSSKTANALWSNITTLSVDDCIILCNKAVYNALGQRELLRILDEADDQCDAAGTVIVQATANMPNVPMQFSISFVESITTDEKKGLFGFRKKNKEEDTENMSIQSTVEGGIIGAAAEAIANSGFVAGIDSEVPETDESGVSFGDDDDTEEMPETAKIPDLEELSFKDFVAPEEPASDAPVDNKVEFLDASAEAKPVEEVSIEEMMKSLFGEMDQSKKEGLEAQKQAEEELKAALVEETKIDDIPLAPAMAEGEKLAPAEPEIPSDSPFVSAFNPFAAAPEVKPSVMEPVSETFVTGAAIAADDNMMDTKTVSSFDSLFAKQVKDDSGISNDGIIAAALRELKEESDLTTIAVEEDKPETEEGKAEEKVEEKKEETPVPEVKVEEAKVEETKAEEAETEDKTEDNHEEKAEEQKEDESNNVTNFVIPGFDGDTMAAASEEKKEEPMPVTVNDDEIVFSVGSTEEDFDEPQEDIKPFDPYNAGSTDIADSAKSVMFPTDTFGGITMDKEDNEDNEEENGGEAAMSDDTKIVNEPSFDWKEEGTPEPLVDTIPAPEFDIVPNEEKNPIDNVNFPLSSEPASASEPAPAPVEEEELPVEVASDSDDMVLPFENAVIAEADEEPNSKGDIPDMPVFGSQTYDSPSYAVNSEQPVTDDSAASYSVGEYRENEDLAPQQAPYQSFGSETFEDEEAQQVPYQEAPADQGYYGEGYAQEQQPYDSYEQFSDPNAQYQPQDFAQNEGYYDQNYAQGYDQNYAQGYNQNYEAGYGEGYEQFSEPNTAPYDYDEVAAATAAAAAAAGTGMGVEAAQEQDDWINNILGIDNYETPAPAPTQPVRTEPKPRPKTTPISNPNGQRPNPNRPTGGNNPNRRPGQPPRPAAGGGRGGNGGGKKPFRLSRNGAIFLAFVAVVLIVFIVIIVLIAKSCSSDKKKEKEAEETKATEVAEVIETIPNETAPAAPVDPTAPIGTFAFSDATGYRTWWDLFKRVYNIEIEGDSDPKIQTLLDYNVAVSGVPVPEGYKPSPNEVLLLPPKEILEGTMAMPGGTAPAATGDAGTVSGEASIGDGDAATGDATGETTAAADGTAETTAAQ